MKRDAAATIFRTVVIAGAMLGAPACGGGKKSATAPKNSTTTTAPATGGDQMMKTDDTAKKPDANAEAAPDADADDPCAGGERPRGTADEGGETGRGFILS